MALPLQRHFQLYCYLHYIIRVLLLSLLLAVP